jgi:hypothetical protein
MWSILPSGSPEFPWPEELPAAMRKNRIAVLRLSPKTDNFPEALWAVDYTLALAQVCGIMGLSGCLLRRQMRSEYHWQNDEEFLISKSTDYPAYTSGERPRFLNKKGQT